MSTDQQLYGTDAVGDEAAEPAAIRLDGVSRHFGETIAVDSLHLELPPGEFFSLLGPSGCGKTTTLRMVGGFELPSAGTVYLDGRDVTGLPPYKRDVNTVFQSYALFPHLNVFENVAFGLRRRGRLDRDAVRRRVEENLELVGLAGFSKRRPTQISGGQAQRVALARALVNHPKVLLLDEPMGALDARIRKSMQVELKRIQREVGITFLYVTHDQSEAMAMSDRLAVMHSGHCEDMGPPVRVYDQPATRFTAEFLGSCNLLELTVDGGVARLADGTAVRMPDGGQVRSGSTLGIRPEKLLVGPVGSELGGVDANRLQATVTTATYLGASTEYELSAPWGERLGAFAQNLDPDARLQAGDPCEIVWDPAHSFLLAEDSV
ncbi:MAG TPA: ABC transporter ATP-binding protein [Solirubrobacteraceae bacterium]|jgi:spermidine/putrescine transport system ATP-binding protein|nr:ABC transporter ATP-binding protein [Solirubrobacteraceae bacterium]